MKKNILLSVFLTYLCINFICCFSYNIDNSLTVDYGDQEIIQFETYWLNFRYAILAKDQLLISSLIKEELHAGCYYLKFENYEDSLQLNKSITIDKSTFLDKIDILFTTPYVLLLEKYDIEKEINNIINNNFNNKYICYVIYEEERYYSKLQIEKDGMYIYKMGHQIEHGFNGYFEIHLRFVKTVSGFKLFGLDCEFGGFGS